MAEVRSTMDGADGADGADMGTGAREHTDVEEKKHENQHAPPPGVVRRKIARVARRQVGEITTHLPY